ncbi:MULTISPECIES: PhoX family phosphatase [Vibrio]|uniref:PhoX family phosphatase n=3 Tax=Vibrio TaxID=662 RepID=A0A2N7ND90_9VIBR|nr:PhoX family phosphatase [Vibrio tasmaniensis]PMP10509.1 dTDP-glucose 4,6-dehydratase [Vibrio tasmaniensis]TKG35304.1 PhoX family phosphatase [Vibrio tasmaniensis]TKG41177.1 PhoX family phosphatase [Vibrio tasmaniensis]TKG47640.1 PhoX family phosphatase [Vibrio tasmaniensis]TKG48216.1 PhoX family phosphatase [Vibrio tasmaniensis]
MSKETFDSTRFNKSNNKPFEEVLDANLSRRNVLKGGLGISAMTAFGAFGLAGHSTANATTMQATGAHKSTATLAFESVKGSLTDSVVVPKGYTAQVLVPWGTPLNKQGKAWLKDGTNNAQDQANSLGMHHDGMHFFPLDGNSNDGLLVINHEYIDQKALHTNGPTYNEGARPSLDEVRKEINAHGVSVVRVKLDGNQWVMVDNDPLNRRYTGATVMDLSGPVAHSEFTKTKFSQDGSQARGTLNNCGNGYTPWGTYLTCEENWPGYFVNKGETTPAQERIGIATDKTRYGWDTLSGNKQQRLDEFARFDVTPSADSPIDDYRNEAHGHGYIVEIDPYTANSRAKKRSALGCFRHEGCTFGKLTEGEPIVFYSGHDSRFEYLYKFVSEAKWDPRDAEPSNRLSAGDKYMDKGTLYVAKFNDDGSGTWLPLTLSSKTKNGGKLGDSFDSQAALIINTAGAADLVGATPMDRPEWCSVDPMTGTVYLTLTNNNKRKEANSANPRVNNKFGHVIRWDEGKTASEFDWDIFVFGSPAVEDKSINRSGLTDMNQFASPDGLAFDARGILWIQTDNGADEVTGYTNDQMLAVVPSQLTGDNGNSAVIDANNQAQLKRFFVGPNGCEVTGFTISPDFKSLFVNIQHPANWPSSEDATAQTQGNVRPRASTVVIRREDGGEIAV